MSKQKIKVTPDRKKTVPFLWQLVNKYYLIIFVFGFALYGNSIFNNYNLDDELVTINHRLTSKGIFAIPEIFASPYYEDASGYSYEYRPAVLVSFAIEHQFWGDNPNVSHFFNVLLYALLCLLLLRVLKDLFQKHSPIISFAITLLFVAHTSHTEVVSSIKNRDEILALIFGLISLHIAMQVILYPQKRWLLFLLPLTFCLALMGKLSIASFALIIPLLLISFTNGRYKSITLISVLLEAPLFFFIQLNAFDRFELCFGISMIVSLYYIIFNFKIVLAYVTKNSSTIFKEAKQFWSIAPIANYSIPQSLKEFIPEVSILSPAAISVTVLLGLICIVCIAFSAGYLGAFVLVILLALSWSKDLSWAWWGYTISGFALVYNYYFGVKTGFIGSVTNHEMETLLTTYLGFSIVFGKRNFFLPGLICLITISIIGNDLFTNSLSFVLIFLLAYRWVRFFLLAFYVLTVVLQLLSYESLAFIKLIPIFGGIALIIAVHYKKHIGLIYSLWVLAAIFLLNTEFKDESKKLISVSLTSVEKTTNLISLQKAIKKSVDRPLSFSEVCINQNDPVLIRVGTSMEILLHYLNKTILPYPLAFYYGYKFVQPQKITDTVPLISLIIHLLLFLLALYLLHKDPLISIGLFMYLFSIATFSNYLQSIPGMVADRYLLVPTLGWSIVVIGVLRKFSGIADSTKNVSWTSIKPAAKYPFLAILLLYSALTFSRNFDWKDDLTLFRHDIEYVNESAQAHNLLALHLMIHSTKEANVEKQNALAQEALLHFKKAQEIYPPFFNVAYDIGRVSSMLNMPDSAIHSFEYALTLDSTLPDIYMRLGDLYFAKNDIQRANSNLVHYIQLVPNDYAGYSKLSYNYYLLKQYDRSVKTNLEAIGKTPGLAAPYINIAQIFLETNQRDSARVYLLQAKQLSPNDAELANKINQLGF